MNNSVHGERKILVHHHTTTGKIIGVVKCYERDINIQHAYPDHEYLDVTDIAPHNLHPHLHQIDPVTKGIIARVVPVSETQRWAMQKMEQEYGIELGRDPDLQEVIAAAALGGVAEKKALENAMAVRFARRQKLAKLHERIKTATTHEEVNSVKWNET